MSSSQEISCPPTLEDGLGNLRSLGLLPARCVNPFLTMAEVFPLQDGRLQEIEIASWESPYVSDQGMLPSCSGHATRCCFDAAWTTAGFVRPQAPFSGTYVYSWCHGGQNCGAILGDVCTALRLHGICTEQEAPSHIVSRGGFATTAHMIADQYRPQLIFQASTYDDLLQLVAWGIPVVFGIVIGDNFSHNRLESDAMAPLPDNVIGGHAMCAIALRRHRRYGLVPEAQNSWGTRWGRNGRCLLRREHFAQRLDAYGIVAVSSIAGNMLSAA